MSGFGPVNVQGICRTCTPGDPLALVSGIEQRVRDLDRNLSLYKIATMEQNLSDSLMRRRFAMLLLATGVLIPLVAMRALASLL